MSKNNYNKMYESNKEKKIEDTTSIEHEIVKTEIVDDSDTIEQEQPVVDEVKTKPNTAKAIVYNCAKLNVREAPNPKADIVTTINAGDEVTIYNVVIDEPGDNYYSVRTESGVEGYCVKDYLKMK